MKTKFNRFAIAPVMCSDCLRYIWLEPYRVVEVMQDISPCCSPFLKKRVCKDCIKDYNIGKNITPRK